MKYLLFCFVLLTGCNSAINYKDYPHVEIGIAENTEYGAIIRENRDAYLIKGLQKWDSIYLGKELEIRGDFKYIEKTRTRDANPVPDIYCYIRNASWRLYFPAETIGIAENTDAGAIIRSNGEVYLMKYVHKWDDAFLGEEVEVRGNFTLLITLILENQRLTLQKNKQKMFCPIIIILLAAQPGICVSLV